MPTPETAPVVVSSLICHRDVEMAMACLGSMVRHSAEPVSFRFHDDGSLTGEDYKQLFDALPVHSFVPRKEADQIVKQELAAYPYCARYRRHSVYGLKLFDAPLLACGDELAFCDTDILFMRPFSGLFEWPDAETGCLFMRDYQNAFAFRPWHLALQWRFQMPVRLNCGLFYFQKRNHDLDFLEWLLSRYHRLFAVRHHWVEQTCWGALAMRCGGRFWSEEQVFVAQNEASFTGHPIAAHLVTPVRGLLPKLLAWPETGRGPEAFVSEAMPRLGAFALGREQAGKLIRRVTGKPS